MNTTSKRIALITGAGTGIGKAAAKALLRGGYRVALVGRTLGKLKNAIVEIGGSSENCLAIQCDVGKPEVLQRLRQDRSHRAGIVYDQCLHRALTVSAAHKPEQLRAVADALWNMTQCDFSGESALEAV